MTARTRSAVVVAAGALVWREHEGRLEVLLIHRPRYDDWSWPKGKRDRGEAIPVAAVREVAEETGLDVALGVPFPMLRYRVSGGRTKEVHYWAATELPEDSPARAARAPVPRSEDEVDELRWVTPDVAKHMLSKRSDRKPLKSLVALHADGRLATGTVVVVRHASARSRASWNGTEALRPLTPSGVGQADGIVPVLAAYGIAAVVTSPWERCAATVAPYAKASGIVPEPLEALTEAGHAAEPGRVRKLAKASYRAAAARAAVALCTHRPVLPSVLEPLDKIAPGWVKRARPHEDPYLRPASIAVVHTAGTGKTARVVGFEVQSARA